MLSHLEIGPEDLHQKIHQKRISLGGNLKLKIYGKLNCKSGKRMKKQNRVFFSSEEEAIEHNFRPCGHCMKSKYKTWKNGLV
ncbi:Ada metal-binding domain-containing protein [Lacihabitans sp. CS3-21]|uniref:Ada metal-binding domain-containing protein n=1 Tax=Lacihabitans sp. CS3-21 TaxID=2487332 RepID=UPI0020CF69A3|nr:Ada metal-binding domain-containing protein [Lacihabitans sp. CS3-21]MCP9746027.1 metal-binding protein [Lacihabitans sp. CS3-21]